MVKGDTPKKRFESLKRYLKRRTKLATDLDTAVFLEDMPSSWATASIEKGIAVYRISRDAADQPAEFLTKLAIHELAHVVDMWLFDGCRTRGNKSVYHDVVWRRLCRVLGDPDPQVRPPALVAEENKTTTNEQRSL